MKRKMLKILSAVLALSMLLGCVSVPAFAADEVAVETEKVKTIEDYPEEAYLMDANDKKSIEAIKGFKAVETNTNEKQYAAEWKFKDSKIATFTSVKDIAGFETIEVYMYGDEEHTATMRLIINAQNPDTEGSDYYSDNEFQVQPGWNKYTFSISALKSKKSRSPRALYDIDSICFYATGWGMDEKNDFENTVVYMDSVKLIRGSTVLEIKPVVQPETEAGTAKYFEYKFEEEKKDDITGINFAAKSNKIELKGDKKNQYLSIAAQGTVDDCFIDIPVKYTKRYMVIGGDFMMNNIDTTVVLINAKDQSGAQNQFVKANKAGDIIAAGKTIGKMEEGKWVNITVCADITSHLYNVYIDGKAIAEKLAMDKQDFGNITLFRTFVSANSNCAVNIDNLVMYDGKTPDDYKKAVDAPAAPEVKEEEGVKVIDVNTDVVPAYKQVKSNAVAEVKDAVCLKVNSPFALVRHEQKAIDENNKDVSPFIINGRTLVPVRFISEAFGAEVTWDDATRTVTVKKDSDTITLVIGSNILNKNGTDITIDVPAEIYNDRTMLPLRAVTENLGKKVFWDDMGLIIISDKEINFTKEKDLDKMLDIMAGFTYERPGQAKLKADILAKTPNHPRVLATAEDFARIKTLMTYDENMQKWVAAQIATADKFVSEAPNEEEHVYYADAGGRLGSSYSIISKATSMGLAWQLTGDKKYVDAIWYTLEDMCAWEHWHPGHFLNTADVMQGVAIAYDWMYDAWTPEQKVIIEEALYDCGIEDTITAYHGANDYLSPPMGVWQRSQWWYQGSNWNAHCNGGVMVAAIAMATHEKYGDLAVKAMDYALNAIEVGLRCYAPDGGYEEGPSYWSYGTDSAVMLMAALTTATGTNYGLSDAPGFEDTYATPLYMESKMGLFNFSDASVSRTDTSTLFWFGNEYNNPQVSGIRLNELAGSEKNPTYTDILWYRPENISADASLAMDYSFYAIDTMTLRSSWTDENQLFVGFHGGENNAPHGHNDAGTFILDSLGVRWFMDIGSDNYNMPGYFGGYTKRYLYYTLRAEGHNTIVVNPGNSDYDQIPSARAKVVELASKPRGAYGKIDMTAAHGTKNVANATRGVMLASNRKAVVIQDEMTLKAPYEFYWFAHTIEQVEIAPDGRSAILTHNGTKKLHVAIVSDNADLKFGLMDAVLLPTSPASPATKEQPENSRAGIKKLFIHGSGDETVNLAVVCQPLVGGVAEYEYTYTPLDSWSVPDGEILTPEVVDIKVAGATVEGFGSKITGYEYVLPYGTTAVPEVSATADALSDVQVTLPEALPGTAAVKVMNKEDPSMYSVYTVSLRAADEIEIEASNAQEGNPGSNCLDKNLGTRWAVEGESWGIFRFAVPKTISSVWIATWKADQRKLIFDIEVSEDGENFTKVWSGKSAADTDTLEEFKIPEGTYKAVKLVLHGTTTGAWNSLLEVEFK